MTKAIVTRINFTPDQMQKTIKDVICKGASEAEFQVFALVWRATELNPLNKELYWLPKIGPYISYKGYLKLADRNPNYDGKEHEFYYLDEDSVISKERSLKSKLYSCIAKVYRKDRRMPEVFEAKLTTYKKNNPAWNTYTELMLKIKAERGALMNAFAIEKVEPSYEIDEDELPDYITQVKILEPNEVSGPHEISDSTDEKDGSKTSPGRKKYDDDFSLSPLRAKFRTYLKEMKKFMPGTDENVIIGRAIGRSWSDDCSIEYLNKKDLERGLAKMNEFINKPPSK